jgi:hypothetical protein
MDEFVFLVARNIEKNRILLRDVGKMKTACGSGLEEALLFLLMEFRHQSNLS